MSNTVVMGLALIALGLFMPGYRGVVILLIGGIIMGLSLRP
jgi:hypothetical protein